MRVHRRSRSVDQPKKRNGAVDDNSTVTVSTAPEHRRPRSASLFSLAKRLLRKNSGNELEAKSKDDLVPAGDINDVMLQYHSNPAPGLHGGGEHVLPEPAGRNRRRTSDTSSVNSGITQNSRVSGDYHNKRDSINSVNGGIESDDFSASQASYHRKASRSLNVTSGSTNTPPGGLTRGRSSRSHKRSESSNRHLANVALGDLFALTGGRQWRNNSLWMAPMSDVSQWYGLSIERGSLRGVSLLSNNLRGHIPETVGDLRALVELNLSYNHGLTGSIPQSIANLTRLKKLHMNCGSLSGPLPDGLGALVSLEELVLSSNKFQGALPPSLGLLTRLKVMQLNSNNLEGHVPSSFSNLNSLEQLDLGYNTLSGTFSDALAAGMVCLKVLSFTGNEKFRHMPPEETGLRLQHWLNEKRLRHLTDLQQKLDANEEILREHPEFSYSSTEVTPQQGHVTEVEMWSQVKDPFGAEANHRVASAASAGVARRKAAERSSIDPKNNSDASSGGRKRRERGTEVGTLNRRQSTGNLKPPSGVRNNLQRRNSGAFRRSVSPGRPGSVERITNPGGYGMTAMLAAHDTYVGVRALKNERSSDRESGSGSETASRRKFSLDMFRKKKKSSTGSGDEFTTLKLSKDETDLMAEYLLSSNPPDIGVVLAGEAPAPFTLENFRSWAEEYLAAENLDFWEAVQTLKLEPDSSRVPALAARICRRFLDVDSDTAVNISHDAKDTILIAWDELQRRIPPGTCLLSPSPKGDEVITKALDAESLELIEDLRKMFGKAEREIYNLLKSDTYSRFVMSINEVLDKFARGQPLTLPQLQVVQATAAYRKQQRVSLIKKQLEQNPGNSKFNADPSNVFNSNTSNVFSSNNSGRVSIDSGGEEKNQ